MGDLFMILSMENVSMVTCSTCLNNVLFCWWDDVQAKRLFIKLSCPSYITYYLFTCWLINCINIWMYRLWLSGKPQTLTRFIVMICLLMAIQLEEDFAIRFKTKNKHQHSLVSTFEVIFQTNQNLVLFLKPFFLP